LNPDPLRHFATIAFVLAGVVNLYPLIGVLGAESLQSLYGVPTKNADVLLLLRHRAVLFGLLGVLLIYAAFRPAWRRIALIAGLTSMVTFLFLALPLGGRSRALQQVFWVDLLAIVVLVAGAWLASFSGKKPT
jgi:hypothetical protein